MLTLGDGVRARKEKARRRLLKCEIMFQLYTLRAHINREFIRTDARRRVLGSREESGLFGSEAAAELSQGVKEVLLCTKALVRHGQEACGLETFPCASDAISYHTVPKYPYR